MSHGLRVVAAVTVFSCPYCDDPSAEVEHGSLNAHGAPTHVHRCPTCGESDAIPAYDCRLCAEVLRQRRAAVSIDKPPA